MDFEAMNDDATDKLLAELERDEAWLAVVMAQHGEPECRSLEQVKHRVRIEMLEDSLACADVPGPADDVLGRIKRELRAELAELAVSGEAAQGLVSDRVSSSRLWEHFRVVAGSLAAAAVLTFAFLPWTRSMENASVETGLDSVALFAAAVESVSGELTNEDEELWTLSAALEDMEDEWVVPSDSWFDDEVDDLEDDIDRLLIDSATAWEV